MATRQERQTALESMSDPQIEDLREEWGGTWQRAKMRVEKIKKLLDDADEPGKGDGFDRKLSLPTNQEQQVQLQRDGVGAAKASARAAWTSAIAALVAIIISIIALLRSCGVPR